MTQISPLHRASVPFVHLQVQDPSFAIWTKSVSPMREIAGTRNILPPH